MLICIGYIKKKVIFRRHYREVFVPIYSELGPGAKKEKPASKEIKRET